MTEKVRPDYGDADYSGPERRAHGDEVGPFAGLPTWARVIAVVGIPGGIALFLVWITASYVPKIQTELQAYRLEAEKNRLAVERQLNQSEQSYRILQRICAEIAKSEEGRARCFDR